MTTEPENPKSDEYRPLTPENGTPPALPPRPAVPLSEAELNEIVVRRLRELGYL